MVTEAIKSGYEQTEVGVIPEDWYVVEFGDITDYTKGFAFKSKDYTKSGVRIIRVSDTTYDSIKDDNEIFISEKEAKFYKKWRLNEDDLIFSTVGSKPPMYDSLVGRAIIVKKKYAGCLLNQNAVIIRAKNKTKLIQQFLLNHFRTKRYPKYIEAIFRGNANQASITLKELFKYPLPLPKDPNESSKIAQVLSDTDTLIEQLDKLITKKKNLKQGAMQELLTGKKRLPGFSGEWETKSIKEVVLKQNKTSRKSGDGLNEGKYPFFNNSAKPVDKYLNEHDFDDEMIISNTGGMAYFDYYNGKFAAMSDCFVFKTKEFTKFIYYKLKLLENYVNDIGFTGSGIKHLDKKLFGNTELSIPSDPQEQSAIAQVLSDMDSEIEELKGKRDKYQMIKKGMMQQLLTGRIRLKWKN